MKLSVKPGCKASGGEITSENDDMSSDKECERHSRRKPKVSSRNVNRRRVSRPLRRG